MLFATAPAAQTVQRKDMNTTTIRLFALLLAFGLGSVTLAGCDDQGPAEETGEQFDDTADDIGDEFD